MENVAVEAKKHRRIAVALSIIPGFGQFYHRQFFKGLILLVFATAYFVVFSNLFNIGLWGIWTLGTKPFRDDSLFLMVEGIIAILVIAIGLGIYIWNFYDAYQNGKKRDRNLQIHSIRDQYRNMVDSGFPYIILSP
ncbi:MAG TPA: sugar ABC transporter permease, partial [Bacillales bacterium]|nr:sugar ABC transporter permease [Bacillales bacterium]